MEHLTEKDVGRAAELLRKGGVVAIPTETVYGLASLWNLEAAREKIYKLKRRPASRRLPMMASSVAVAVAAGVHPDRRLEKLAARFWPGALTVVVPAENGESVGLRIPDHPFVLALLRELHCPIACTSANLSGRAAGLTAAESVRELDGEPEAVVDGGRSTETEGMASTVVSLLGEKPVILREGPISLAEIENALA